MTTSLYHRNGEIRLTIGPGEVINIPHRPNNRLRGIDFSFTVKKGLDRRLNEATARIINLSESTRTRIETAKRETLSAIEISAGYLGRSGESAVSGVIFRGEITEIKTTRESTDAVTEVLAADGLAALRDKRVKGVFTKGVAVGDVVKQICEEAGLKVSGNVVRELTCPLPSDTTINGPSYKAAEKLARSCGYYTSVQNGTVQIDPIKPPAVRNRGLSTTLNKDVYVLTYKSGLLEAPSRSKNGYVTAKCLMLYDIAPGRYVKFENTDVDGHFRVTSVEFEGDTAGNPWFVTCQCQEV